MDLLSISIGFVFGFIIGSGIVLAYVSYSFSRSVRSFQDELDMLAELAEEEEN